MTDKSPRRPVSRRVPFRRGVARLLQIGLPLAFAALNAGAARADCAPGQLGHGQRAIAIAPGTAPLGLQSYPRTLRLQEREVVLTFDDGPVPGTTDKVLSALAEECVKATFFLIGRNVAAHPALVKRAAAEGHSLGHHSHTHPAGTLCLMGQEKAIADIEAGVAADAQAAGAEKIAPFFRFPGYADTDHLLDYMRKKGFTVFGSDLWASDWKAMTPKAELDLVLERLEKAGRGIILFHDSSKTTAAMLPDFLKELKKRGYKVAHLVPGEGPTDIVQAPDGWTSTTQPIIQRTLAGKCKGASGDGAQPAPESR